MVMVASECVVWSIVSMYYSIEIGHSAIPCIASGYIFNMDVCACMYKCVGRSFKTASILLEPTVCKYSI